MRAGGVGASFSQQPDPVAGRVDIAIVRRGDLTGVAGTGLLAGLLFEPVAAGPANLAVTGSASGPNGSPVSLQFASVAAVRDGGLSLNLKTSSLLYNLSRRPGGATGFELFDLSDGTRRCFRIMEDGEVVHVPAETYR